MDRSRSKRYYYDNQDFDPEPMHRTTKQQRYNNSHYAAPHRRGPGGGGGRKDPNLMVTTTYRILCHDVKAGGVIGKSGSIIKSIRQHTGAWINMHELIPGDEERIIEISDTRRRDPDGRMPSFSPAQEALFLIHERILESDVGPGYSNVGFGDEDEEYGMRGGANRVVTRLVVSRMHVGSLLGKGGKIIEQMRMETRTHIRVLPRDHNIPRCVSMSEEIVQILGDMNNVKNAIAIISSRLRESQHRDRGNFHGRLPSPERFFPPDDDYVPHMNHGSHRSSMDSPGFESRLSTSMSGPRGSHYSSHQSSFAPDSGPMSMDDNEQSFPREDIVFQILCPIEKIDNVIGDSDGIVDLLQNEIGVDVRINDPVFGSDEQIIIISSEEVPAIPGPDDELFPAQEALLHIQTRIVDIIPEKQNVITTRLLVPSGEIGCLEGRHGLPEIRKITGADIQILPREELPVCVSENDELLQIVGEIKAAREALVEVTSRLRSYLYQDFYPKDISPSPRIANSSAGTAFGQEAASNNNLNSYRETGAANLPNASSQNVQSVAPAQPTKDPVASNKEAVKQTENERRESVPSIGNRFHGPLVTRSTLEVVIPPHAVPKLITKSKNKLAQISELSGAKIKLIEEGEGATDNVIQISGTPEQAERAQSLLQGFILSTLEED
ncbi:RNA-binding KH domain-containing protein RCF3-like isoform X1 [Daucus carota subsp. sativus]|uniref:RNA-binding KH domain-containing protein RCF3-like isoform X1 n=1 Tax=Daucus carota subsp. sativus TaxID=79200 RepID=UPI0007EFC1C9|nr:PREDICTED: KH domain-containing protein At4g18375-like isoform X1 [Daucus carota subsp. sativus]